jgi:hypothetical protein
MKKTILQLSNYHRISTICQAEISSLLNQHDWLIAFFGKEESDCDLIQGGAGDRPSIVCINHSSTIAVTGQLSTACWQSQVSQPFGFVTHALSSLSSNTLGQSSEQSPQPMHKSISTLGVAMLSTILS